MDDIATTPGFVRLHRRWQGFYVKAPDEQDAILGAITRFLHDRWWWQRCYDEERPARVKARHQCVRRFRRRTYAVPSKEAMEEATDA